MTSAETPSPFPFRRHLTLAAGVFLVTLGLRLLYLLASPDRSWPHSVNYEGDAVIWARAADLLAQGQVPDEGVPHRFYAIAYLLHWASPSGMSRSYLAFKVFWCLLSALSCAVAYLAFVRNLPARAANLATALCVFSFGSYVLATSLNVEGLYAPLLMLVVAGTLELVRSPSWWKVAGLALLNGLLLLAREEHMVLMVGLSGYAFYRWRRPTACRMVPLSRKQRVLHAGAVIAGAALLCLPYSVHATRATLRYNTVPKRPPNYEEGRARWSADARQFIDALPAFVRAKTVAFVGRLAEEQGAKEVDREAARAGLLSVFGYLPEPLATPVFIASHGPMSFALANHPRSEGGFSRAALETAGQRDPKLNFTLPEHLRIFNHGYAVGWGYITGDFPGWLANVGKKLVHAYQGASLGFSAYNLPFGRYGERRSCDLLTPAVGSALAWKVLWGALLVLGAAMAWRQPNGGLWLLVVAYKLVIVILYYGYARQTVSILPVFLVLAALGIDGVLGFMGRRVAWRPSPAVQWIGAFAVIVVAVNLDIRAARFPAAFEVVGPTRPTPEWGPQAFSSNAPIQIRKPGGS